ncbi:hypothetical protein A1O3_09489 [Capronia epimyces CBS 606.96]|uniref:C2H2-type domain-containing protein n=1 Tax=Capronia epimyces CBS 606.96 TaxID=1182542 RepID=W9XDQ9_9EURO|nr:uncharacterized protein A1O3_09489 [Capronia epimyces CBS 606.96]EXJ78328.1 hypothetical protein A1O3_09489 [Capronia epimyces CBS 606.96]
MSFLHTQPPDPQRHVQHVSSLTAPRVYRTNPSLHRNHNSNASITSNPTHTQQDSQQGRDGLDCWPSDPAFNLPVASPGILHPSANLFSFEEDTTSHHESSFDDFLTTECSSDNHISEHTTPQELIWERQFVSQDPTRPHILDNYGHSGFSANKVLLHGTDLEAFYSESQETFPDFVTRQDLSDPKLGISTAHSLDISRETQPSGQGQDQSMARTSASLPQKTQVSPTLEVTTTPDHTPCPNHGVGARQRPAPDMRAPSPVVMVSSYEGTGADRGAQPHFVQSSSKRIRGAEGVGDEDDVDAIDRSEHGDINVDSFHLMPPGPMDTNNVRINPTHRTGLEPPQRKDDEVLSIKDIEEQRQRDERNAEVQTWLETSDAGSEPEPNTLAGNMRRLTSSTRHRANTTGHVDTLGRVYSDKDIPGPGVLVEVDSESEYSEGASVTSSQIAGHTEQILDAYWNSESPHMSPRALDSRDSPDKTSFPALEDEIPPELQEPFPRQFYRRTPWQDPVRGPISGTRDQPSTSNAAAYKFHQEAAKWETASRAATWGTGRRLSESEIRSIVEGSQVRHLSLSKRGRERGNSILSKARGLLPRRGSSNTKPEPPDSYPQSPPEGHAHRSSLGAIKAAQRKPSFSNKPKSPPLNTGSALIAMTGQLAAIGRGNPVTQDADTYKSSGPLQAMKKQRSKSDVSKHGKSPTPGLTELMTRHGGPPVPTLASPMHEREPIVAAQVIDNEDAPADDDEDDQTDEVAIRMDLEIRAEDITPTLEGFKDHARRLNPRLEPYLIERIGQEQIRRYKKLVETKIKHTRAVQTNNKCPSGRFCFDLGGDATLLPPRASSKDTEASLTQFQVCNAADIDIDESGFTEGVVTPALFPPGIPLPPAKRLPAELECPLCFKVKKFHKPSDWTKHVHEDIQPFSCTFPHCAESKSFKRKADWVRHENERHRHLEWWKCSIQECSHVCFRKDNFVQHLVREHKMKEPKVRARGSGSSKNKAVNNAGWSVGQEDHEMWRLVDSCRNETSNKSRDEPCRFCGNVCSSFKKLSVHIGKHLEQIAMPVLQLVSMREVAPDTVVSPVDQVSTAPLTFSTGPGATTNMDGNNLSPYPASATSAYQTSSAGQSPASLPGRSQNSGYHFDPGFYTRHVLTPVMQPRLAGSAYGGPVSMPSQSHAYMSTSEYMQVGDGGHPHEYDVSPQSVIVTPHSQPVPALYNDQLFNSTGADYTQTPMVGMYPNVPLTPGFVPQYASPMLHQPSGHSPMAMDSKSGLGLQTMHQNYVFSAPGDGEAGPNMQYTQ